MERLEGECKVYKGEKDCPESFRGREEELIWLYESTWNQMQKVNDEMLHTFLGEFAAVGLIDFESTDGTPTSLKALLFNRYCKGSWSMKGAVPDFKEWYVSTYQNIRV